MWSILALVCALSHATYTSASEGSGASFVVTLTAVPSTMRTGLVGVADVVALVDNWMAPSGRRSRSVNSGTSFSVHSDHANVTYVTRSAYHTEGGYAVVVGTANSTDSSVVVAHPGTDMVYVFARRNDVVQDGFSISGVEQLALPPVITSSLPREDEPLQPAVSSGAHARRVQCGPERTDDGRTVIRVGVLHTPQAAALPKYASNGGSNAVEMEVVAAVAEANSVVYALSGVEIELQLCANGLIADPMLEKTTAWRTIQAFTTSTGVSTVRDAGACDVMVLFASLPALGSSACGLGYMYPGSHVIVAAPCFKDNFSFIHEIGHILGACHGPPARLCGAGANGYGSATNDFRTIEAYQGACGPRASSCTRIARISSADHAYMWNGWPIGDFSHNNARVLNVNRNAVSSKKC